MKDLVALIFLIISILSFESTFGCATTEVNNMQERYSRMVSMGEKPDEKIGSGISNTPINFPFPRSRYNLYTPFNVAASSKKVGDAVLAIPFMVLMAAIDLPFSFFFDIFSMPSDIYGTANGWYNPKYVKLTPVSSPIVQDKESSELKGTQVISPRKSLPTKEIK